MTQTITQALAHATSIKVEKGIINTGDKLIIRSFYQQLSTEDFLDYLAHTVNMNQRRHSIIMMIIIAAELPMDLIRANINKLYHKVAKNIENGITTKYHFTSLASALILNEIVNGKGDKTIFNNCDFMKTDPKYYTNMDKLFKSFRFLLNVPSAADLNVVLKLSTEFEWCDFEFEYNR